MGRLTGISGRRAVKAFCRAGWQVARQHGSHIVLTKAGLPHLVIPAHREVAPFLLRSQIRRAGLTEGQFEDLLQE